MDKREATAVAKQYAELVAREMNPDKIVLYGSTLHGTRRDDSDIDVAVIFDKFDGNWLDASAYLYTLATPVDYDFIEPLLCTTSQDRSGFVKEILRTGEILYERSSAK